MKDENSIGKAYAFFYCSASKREIEKHFPIFNNIEFNEDDLSFLEKIYDTEKSDYQKLRVNIFKINYDKYQDSLN